MNAVVLYHAHCLDGAVAALVMRDDLPTPMHPVVCIPVTYGEEPPLTELVDKKVFIVDFSYSVEHTLQIAKVAAHVTVLDHHKTAIDRFNTEAPNHAEWVQVSENKVTLIFDLARSGAQLAWDYCNPYDEYSWYVAHTADRDLWKFELADTNAIVKSLFHYVDDLDELSAAINVGKTALISQGRILQDMDDRMVANAIAHHHMGRIGGFLVPCTNSMFVISEVGHALAKGHPFAAVYYCAGGLYKFSLRSNDDTEDVSAIAKRYGGGGHRNAAGFSVTPEQMLGFIATTTYIEEHNDALH